MALALVLNYVAKILFKSSFKTFGTLGGYRAKIALKLRKNAYKIIHEVSYDTYSYITQINNKELIMKAIDSTKAYDFVPKDDLKLEPAKRTVFKVKFMNPHVAANLGDQIYNVSGTGNSRRERILSGTQMFETLKSCLVGWDNMVDPEDDTKTVDFNTAKVEEMIAMIPVKYRNEIADFARGESELEEGEAAS